VLRSCVALQNGKAVVDIAAAGANDEVVADIEDNSTKRGAERKREI